MVLNISSAFKRPFSYLHALIESTPEGHTCSCCSFVARRGLSSVADDSAPSKQETAQQLEKLTFGAADSHRSRTRPEARVVSDLHIAELVFIAT